MSCEVPNLFNAYEPYNESLSSNGQRYTSADITGSVHDLLKTRILDKSRYETVLLRNLHAAQAKDEALRQSLVNEKSFRVQRLELRKELRSSYEILKTDNTESERKCYEIGMKVVQSEKQLKKMRERLEIDLQSSRKVSNRLSESNANIRAMESTLQDILMDNKKMIDELEVSKSEMKRLQETNQKECSELLQTLQNYKMDASSIDRNITAKEKQLRSLNTQLRDKQMKLEVVADDIELRWTLLDKMKVEMENRLKLQENNNNILCTKIAEKKKEEINNLAEKEEMDASIQIFKTQLDEKEKMSLTLANRLNQSNMKISSVVEEIHNQTELQEEYILKKETFKSENDVMEASIEIIVAQNKDLSKLCRSAVENTLELKNESTRLKNQESFIQIRLQKARADRNVFNEKILQWGKQKEDKQAELSDIRGAYGALCCETEEAEIDYADISHQFDNVASDLVKLKNQMEDVVTNLNEANKSIANENESLNESLDNITDKVNQQMNQVQLSEQSLNNANQICEDERKQFLKTKVEMRDMITKLELENEQLTSGLKDEISRNAFITADLNTANERTKRITAQIVSNEKTAVGMSTINGEEIIKLKRQVDDELSQLEKLQNEEARTRAEVDDLSTQFEILRNEQKVTLQELRDEKANEDQFNTQIQQMVTVQCTEANHLANVEQQYKMHKSHFRHKKETIEKMKLLSQNTQTDYNLLQKELKQTLHKGKELSLQIEVNSEKIFKLKEAYSRQEALHIADAHMVQSKITLLQDELIEKNHAVEIFTKQTYTAKLQAKRLQERLEMSETEAAVAQNTLESMIDQEQSTSFDLQKQLDDVKRGKTKLQSLLMTKNEETTQLMNMFAEEKNANSLYSKTMCKTDRKMEEAINLVGDIDNRRDYLESQIAGLDTKVMERKRAAWAKTHTRRELQHQLNNSLRDQMQMKLELNWKNKVNRVLDAEELAKKLNVHTKITLK